MIRSIPPHCAVSDTEAQRLWDERVDMESFLRALRQCGAFQIESINIVRKLSGLSLHEAKEIVHFSATWADMRESAEALHDSAYEAIKQIEREDQTDLAHVSR